MFYVKWKLTFFEERYISALYLCYWDEIRLPPSTEIRAYFQQKCALYETEFRRNPTFKPSSIIKRPQYANTTLEWTIWVATFVIFNVLKYMWDGKISRFGSNFPYKYKVEKKFLGYFGS